MYRSVCAALALVGLTARMGASYGPIDCCMPPCGCDEVMFEGCEPSLPAAPQTHPAPPTPEQTGEAPQPAESVSAAASNVPATSPMQLNVPAAGTPPTAAPETSAMPAADAEREEIDAPPSNQSLYSAQPATDEITPSADAAATEPVDAPPASDRYSTPPTSAPFDSSVFEEAPANTDDQVPPETGEPTSPTEPASVAPADESAATEQPSAGAPEPTENTAPPADDATPPASESTTPSYDELFPPGSSTNPLSVPGGIASREVRVWTDADGEFVTAGRVIKVAVDGVMLIDVDGAEQALLYSDLSSKDLEFLKQQVAARQTQLAAEASDRLLLATQQ